MERTALFLQETITGAPIGADLSHLIAGGTYTDELVGVGDATIILSGTTEVEAGQITPAEAWELLEPNAVEVVLAKVTDAGEVTAIMFTGIVLRADWSDETEQIEIYAEQLRTIWQHRMTFGVHNFPSGDFALTNVSREAALAAILARGTGWGGQWPLPLDLPPSGGSGGFSTDVSRWDATTIEDLIVQLVKYGSEVRFRGYLTATRHLRFQCITAARIVGPTTNISVTAAESPLRKYQTAKDGTRQVTGVWATGKGMGSQMPHAGASGAAGPLVPVRDAHRSAPDITDQTVLQGYAESEQEADRYPRQPASFEIVPNDLFPYAAFEPSRVLLVERTGHRVLPDDVTAYRVLALRGNLATDVITPRIEIHREPA